MWWTVQRFDYPMQLKYNEILHRHPSQIFLNLNFELTFWFWLLNLLIVNYNYSTFQYITFAPITLQKAEKISQYVFLTAKMQTSKKHFLFCIKYFSVQRVARGNADRSGRSKDRRPLHLLVLPAWRTRRLHPPDQKVDRGLRRRETTFEGRLNAILYHHIEVDQFQFKF